MSDETSVYHDGRRSRGGGVSEYQYSDGGRGRGRGGGGGGGGGGGWDSRWVEEAPSPSRSSRPPGRDQQRLSLRVSSSSSPSLDGDYDRKTQRITMNGDDPLSYRGQGDHGGPPIAQGRVVGYDPSPRGSNHSGYSFDAVAAKIAAHDSPNEHPEGPPVNQHYGPAIEIGVGVWSRLRGAQETWSCVERDFYMPVTCFACTLELCCIQDANYVLCPNCRVVSPMDDMDPDHDGGVGLGFTMDDLCSWQAEILAKRNQGGYHHQNYHQQQRRHHYSEF